MKKTPIDDATHVVLAHEDQDQTPPQSSTSLSAAAAGDVFASLARLSLASVGGGLVGLALQRQQERQSSTHWQQPDTDTRRKIVPRALRKGPPSPQQHRLGFSHLPRSWAISCFLFTLILEGSRLVSPASLIYQQVKEQSQQPEVRPTTTTTRAALVTADYTLGGTMAGWAAAEGQQRAASKHGMTPIRGATGRPLGTLTGLLLGTALGLTAGLVQAAVVVAEDYDNTEASLKQTNAAIPSAVDKEEKTGK
jgi:hypothetical protein